RTTTSVSGASLGTVASASGLLGGPLWGGLKKGARKLLPSSKTMPEGRGAVVGKLGGTGGAKAKTNSWSCTSWVTRTSGPERHASTARALGLEGVPVSAVRFWTAANLSEAGSNASSSTVPPSSAATNSPLVSA